ncbi:MAG: response regulator transcription factor [Candidatus Sulfotelmatobacter sp.]
MKFSTATPQKIHIAVIESDPLRFIGFRALLESEADFDLLAAASPEALMQPNLNVVLVRDHAGNNLGSWMAHLRVMRPDLPAIAIGSNTDDEAIISAIFSGVKGYVLDGARPGEFARAIREVAQGSIWAPRRVLSTIIERANRQQKTPMPGAPAPLTDREKEVLKMLVAGLSNKEIGAPLGIVERTVKAHIARMMRKVGVQNRIALSVHAITHSLVSRPPSPSESADRHVPPTRPQ